jgi:hypothetical protein
MNVDIFIVGNLAANQKRPLHHLTHDYFCEEVTVEADQCSPLTTGLFIVDWPCCSASFVWFSFRSSARLKS